MMRRITISSTKQLFHVRFSFFIYPSLLYRVQISMRLWYRLPFHFLPKASLYLVFSWPPKLPKLWKLSTLTPKRTRPDLIFFFAISTAIIPVCFIIPFLKQPYQCILLWIINELITWLFLSVMISAWYRKVIVIVQTLSSTPIFPGLSHVSVLYSRLGPGSSSVGIEVKKLVRYKSGFQGRWATTDMV